MPGHCCVPFCNANYPSGPRVSVFSFPKDEELLKKWIAVIPKENFTPSATTKVCRKHFKSEDILTETSGYDSKKKITISVPLKNSRLKPDAVPSIFEDYPVKQHKTPKKSPIKVRQEKDKIHSSSGTRMQKRGSKSPVSSLSADVNMTDKSNKHDNEKRESAESKTKTSPTTDRPIIAVIKAEDLITDNQKSQEITIDDDEDDDDDNNDEDSATVQESNPSSKPFTIPSPYKNLPNVSVCLKEEDRVPFVRELKGVKRSPSTGSNSSTGSTDAQKSSLFVKRRKVEKPAPVVIGRQNDCYCWVCHRENISLVCIACPRAYHFKCAGESGPITSDWVCPECQRILAAENVDTRSSTLAEISLDKLAALLKLSLNKMKQRAPIAFHQPVSLEHYPLYPHYVIHPMDFSLLEKNIKLKVYGCTEAFLADVKWISHNSCVFNGTQHPLSTNAKNLVKSCDQDMQEIEVCPDCFVHSIVRNKYWFSEVCRKPHPLVWAKLKGFPYWPAKVVRIADGNVDARFFGAHDRAWVPISQCYHLSKEMPTSSKPKKKGNYEVALDELNVHVHLLIQKFGSFEYAPYRTSFNPENKILMYHGIDIDKACKEDIAIDNSFSQTEINSISLEKESRFASFFESECERSSADETKLSESQSDTQPNTPSINNGIESPFAFFKHRNSEDSIIPDREAPSKHLCSSDELKSTSEDKSECEPKSGEETKNSAEGDKATVQDLPTKEPGKTSNSSQLSKLQLALERIKGYVSLNIDNEKENDETHTKETNIEAGDGETEKKSEKEKENVTKMPESLSTQINETIILPSIESNNESEKVVDVGEALEATKKKDSFFLKLNETIESCKAKLGISEINDDLSSDESGEEENASKSDEEDNDEKDDTSVSEEDIASEDEENAEVMEVSGEEDENEDDESKSEEESDEEVENEDNESRAEEVSEESDENIDLETSDTDIECSGVLSPKKNDKVNLRSADQVNSTANNIEVDKSSKEICSDSNEAIIANPEMQVPEVTISVSNTLETTTDNSLSESSNEVRGNSDSSSSNQIKKSETVISTNTISNDSNDSVSGDIKDKVSDVNELQDKEKLDLPVTNIQIKSNSPKRSVENNLSNVNSVSPNINGKLSEDLPPLNNKESDLVEKASDPSSLACENEVVDDDDDDEIYICTPTRPKSPPVIVLDDDQENDYYSSVSDTYAIKSPPFSTSVDSYSSGDNVSSMSPSNGKAVDDQKSATIDAEKSNQNLHEEVLNSKEKNACNDSCGLKKAAEKRKRQSRSESSSDDEIQIVTPAKKTVLTGAIRTFNKPTNNTSSLKPSTPTMETVKRNLAKESLNQEIQSPTSTEKDLETSPNKIGFVSDHILAPQSTKNALRTPVIDTSNLSEKDKEILFLKSKLNCVYTAYQIQSWKCSQEREELRHNMNLIIMELRSCLESDKKQTIEALSRKFEQEKLKCIEETKRKQWCANCLMESRYACCWNTSYCSTDCQKHHFPEHRKSCTQVRSKNLEISDMKLKSSSSNFSENNENKKVFIVNMKSSDSTQQVSVSKSQVQVMASKSVSLQNTATSHSSNIQFLLAPIKSSTESTIVNTPTTTSAKELSQIDSTQVINGVRNKQYDLKTAISLLKKKNMEAKSLGLLSTVEAKKTSEENDKNDTPLEEIYFPSPPRVTFEGYETATPDPSVVILESDETKGDCDTEHRDSELPTEVPSEPDLVLSDTDDKDNEMVSIGHGVDIKTKFLNKCLVYGRTAKKLTRCLIDVIFPDVKLLASCSAFGQKSHVTKFTRAALPTRKVHAIIDYVRKRFPNSTRSEIVLAINMKCKEARMIVNRKDFDSTNKVMFLRKLTRETETEFASSASSATTTVSATSVSSVVTSSVAPSSIAVIASTTNKSAPNVVCVKSTNPNVLPFSMSAKTPQGPNILRCNTSQILIKPKPMLDTAGSPAILQTQVPPTRKRETVKELLAANKINSSGKMPNEGGKLVMAVDTLKQTNPLKPLAPAITTAPSIRPYIILGSQMTAVRPSLTIQNPTLPAPSPVTK